MNKRFHCKKQRTLENKFPMSPYVALRKGFFCRLYIKADIMAINMKIKQIEEKMQEDISSKMKTVLEKMLQAEWKNREFVSRQINQQMLEK